MTGSLGPTVGEAVNWYCCVVIGLIFITDFTPLGQYWV